MLQKISAHARRISYHFGRGITLGGQRFRLQGYHATRLHHADRHEPFLGAVLRRHLRRPGSFVDVGVNIGQTLMKVLAIDRDRAYLGFEPQTACCFFLDQFAQQNGLANVRLLPIALGEANGTLKLYSDRPCDEMASVTGQLDVTGVARRHATLVPVRVGDEVLEEIGIGPVAAIKIDVEGAELQVLRGLSRTLAAHRPPVIFEVLPNFHGEERVFQPPEVCDANRDTASAIAALFDALGYDIFQIDARGDERRIDGFDLDDLSHYTGRDFIAQPR